MANGGAIILLARKRVGTILPEYHYKLPNLNGIAAKSSSQDRLLSAQAYARTHARTYTGLEALAGELTSSIYRTKLPTILTLTLTLVQLGHEAHAHLPAPMSTPAPTLD